MNREKRVQISNESLDELFFSPSLQHAKQIQGEIARDVLGPTENDIDIKTFGGMVVKTEPTKYLGRAEAAHIPPEYLEIINSDTHFHRLHFLPTGWLSAKNLTEALKILYIGTCDLIDFKEWLQQEQTHHSDQLSSRFLFGFSDYQLGRVVKKHLRVFEILSESAPLDPRIGWQRTLMSFEKAMNVSDFFSPYVALGAFVPGFLLQAERLPYQKKRLRNLLVGRAPNLKNHNEAELELQLRKTAILRATGITR